MPKWEPQLTAKVFAGKQEQTDKNLALIRFPSLVSTKWDGWRMFDYGGEATCRSMLPPKNKYVQRRLRELYARIEDQWLVNGLDGEVMVGDVFHPRVFSITSSGLNSYEGEPDFVYYVFDLHGPSGLQFQTRLELVQEIVEELTPEFPFLRYTEHHVVHDLPQLLDMTDDIVSQGGEGVVGRDPTAPYKFGRPSMREGTSWALKPYVDDEAVILSLHEEMHNGNPMVTDAFGKNSRPGGKGLLTGKGTFGKAIMKSEKFEETFSLGAGIGLTKALRQEIWDNPEKWIGRTIKYKYQAIGVKERPRQPKWIGPREKEDLS